MEYSDTWGAASAPNQGRQRRWPGPSTAWAARARRSAAARADPGWHAGCFARRAEVVTSMSYASTGRTPNPARKREPALGAASAIAAALLAALLPGCLDRKLT